MICKKCNEPFAIRAVIDGKERNMQNRKYCLKCSPFGQHNTLKMDGSYDKRSGGSSIDGLRLCKECGKLITVKRRWRCNHCNVVRYRRNLKKKLVDLHGGKCKVCGYDRCMRNLIFHHCNPNEKEFGITGQTKSFERIKKEADKCLLVCCRCHGEIHAGLIDIEKFY